MYADCSNCTDVLFINVRVTRVHSGEAAPYWRRMSIFLLLSICSDFRIMSKSSGPLDALSCQEISFMLHIGHACHRFLISSVVFGVCCYHRCNLSLTSLNLNFFFFGYCGYRYYCNFRRKMNSSATNFEMIGIGFLHDNRVLTAISRIFEHLCKATDGPCVTN
jgi:hypothetical protein